MTNFFLYIAWLILYGLCAALACIPSSTGVLYGICILCGLLFYVPPTILVHRASKQGDKKTLRTVFFISIAWLVMAMIMIVCNILSVGATELAGTVLHYLMVVLTVPMVTLQFWVVAIFLWACLMVVCFQQLRKK